MFVDIALTRSGSWSAFVALAAACALSGCAATGGWEKAPGPGWAAAPEMKEISDPEERIAAQQEMISKDCREFWDSEGLYLTYKGNRDRIYWYTCLPADTESIDKVIAEMERQDKVERCKDDPARGECLDACAVNPGNVWCENSHEYRCRQRWCMKNPDLPECEDVIIPKL